MARQVCLVECMQDDHIVHLLNCCSEFVHAVCFAGVDRSRKEGRDMEAIGLAASTPSCGCRWCRASPTQVGEYGAAFRSVQAAPSCREGAGGQAQPCESKVAGHSDSGSCLLLRLFCIFVLYLKPLHVKGKDVLASLGRSLELKVLFYIVSVVCILLIVRQGDPCCTAQAMLERLMPLMPLHLSLLLELIKYGRSWLCQGVT